MIAEKLGVKHPEDPKTGTPIVMTTDFLITYKDKEYARTVKPAAELENDRMIAKFEIERIYWETHHIDWGIITERDLPNILIRNIEWIHKEFYNEDVTELGVFVYKICKEFYQIVYMKEIRSLGLVCPLMNNLGWK